MTATVWILLLVLFVGLHLFMHRGHGAHGGRAPTGAPDRGHGAHGGPPDDSQSGTETQQPHRHRGR